MVFLYPTESSAMHSPHTSEHIDLEFLIDQENIDANIDFNLEILTSGSKIDDNKSKNRFNYESCPISFVNEMQCICMRKKCEFIYMYIY